MTTTVALITLFIAAVWLVGKRLRDSSTTLEIPYLEFDGDNSPERYARDTREIMQKGYRRYSKKGIPFAMRNPVDRNHPQVIMPQKYLESVRNAPQSVIDFYSFLEKSSVMKDVGGPPLSNEASDMVRIDLTRALSDLISQMQDDCTRAFQKGMPSCQDWTPLFPFEVLLDLFARTIAQVLYGAELAGRDDWLVHTIYPFINHLMLAPPAVISGYHPSLRFLAKYFETHTKMVYKGRKQAEDILRPILDKYKMQRATPNEKKAPRDGIRWLLDWYDSLGKELTPELLAQDLLFVTVAAIQTSAAVGCSILFDMMDRPVSLSQIRAEISSVKEACGGNWNRQSLAQLRFLDSFMKESKRVHTFTQVTVERMVVVPYRFDDGLQIPAGTQLSFPNQQLNLDDDVYPDAETFQADRFLKKRMEDDPNKHHFASVSEDSITWGSGYHACPGRFLAQDTLKLLFIYLLDGFEFKHVKDSQTRPKDMYHGFAIGPDVTMPVLSRRRG
ncbi:cytochrome P450 [Xylaria grammica]|nr:cytochrome P450 [Xylaria grammica]